MTTREDPFVAERRIGAVVAVDGSEVTVALPWAGHGPATLFGSTVPRGEVGEFVVISARGGGAFGRISRIEAARSAQPEVSDSPGPAPIDEVRGTVQLLGTIRIDGTFVRGVERHPRIGEVAYSATSGAIRAALTAEVAIDGVLLPMGVLRSSPPVSVDVSADALLGRHLAIVGATGGGKSWTLATLIEQCAGRNVRVLLVDATGEFHPLGGVARHLEFATSPQAQAVRVHLPHRQLSEGDRRALLRPSGGSQAPKLRAAIRSLRLAHVLGDDHALVSGGLIPKQKRPRKPWSDAIKQHASVLDSAQAAFDLRRLADQVAQECVYENDRYDEAKFGDWALSELAYCNTLIARIHDLISTGEVMDVLDPEDSEDVPSLLDEIDSWIADGQESVLRVSLGDLTFNNYMREIVVNTVGRHLLTAARAGKFNDRPLLVAIDEAHQFFGHGVADEFVSAQFDAFELVAKEGRKYGLVICMATQRPGDLPVGVLSQAGAMIVHRLTDRRDRERVEHAASDLSASAARQLPALTPGEALLIGSGFSMPVPLVVARPSRPPRSAGPRFV